LHDANGLAALAIITTVVPGTVWSELAVDRSALLLHLFDVDDEQAYVSYFKQRYEKPLTEIFE
jgi:multicomponent K+:H+ antiporter subunit E